MILQPPYMSDNLLFPPARCWGGTFMSSIGADVLCGTGGALTLPLDRVEDIGSHRITYQIPLDDSIG